jgi:hypothetical protein
MLMLPGENMDWELMRRRILKHPEWQQKFHPQHIATTIALRGCEDALYTSWKNDSSRTDEQRQVLEFVASSAKFKGQRKLEPFIDWNNGKVVQLYQNMC